MPQSKTVITSMPSGPAKKGSGQQTARNTTKIATYSKTKVKLRRAKKATKNEDHTTLNYVIVISNIYTLTPGFKPKYFSAVSTALKLEKIYV